MILKFFINKKLGNLKNKSKIYLNNMFFEYLFNQLIHRN